MKKKSFTDAEQGWKAEQKAAITRVVKCHSVLSAVLHTWWGLNPCLRCETPHRLIRGRSHPLEQLWQGFD